MAKTVALIGQVKNANKLVGYVYVDVVTNELAMSSVEEFAGYLRVVDCLNAKAAKEGHIIPTQGGLDRLTVYNTAGTPVSNPRIVILNRLINTKQEEIGYRIVTPQGVVVNAPLKKVLELAEKYGVQNGRYIREKGKTISHLGERDYVSVVIEQAVVEKPKYGSDMDKYKDFNSAQKAQIFQGLKSNLHVAIYAKPEFTDLQMNEIRLGLQTEVDVRYYANKAFNPIQMGVVRKGLEQKLDVKHYANPKFTPEQMKVILFGLQRGVDVSEYANPAYSPYHMTSILLKYIDISEEVEAETKA